MQLRKFFGILAIVLILGVGPTTRAWQDGQLEQVQSGAISAPEFSRIITEFSEEDGFFRSDNFVSNETSYLHVLDKMRAMGCRGGAYVGVGPEQNFTYIARIHPRIAFIIDIRRQAMIQHLMYKALFHLSNTRVQFLSYLFSKPIAGEDAPGGDAPIDKIVSYFEGLSYDNVAFTRNLYLLRKTIVEDFRIPLTDRDLAMLEYVYTAFRDENLNIQYRSGGPNWPGSSWNTFPTLGALLLEKDLKGKPGNFLANSADYDFVRGLQESNRIIPVVGDFSGSKALPAVADYLKKNGYWVSAFYTSNVEQYLFANGVFNDFAENVKKLPVSDKSLFIRSFPNMREPHPAKLPGHRLTTLLERIPIFLRDFDQGIYEDYWALVTNHYIAGDEP